MKIPKIFNTCIVVDTPWMTETEWEMITNFSQRVVAFARPGQKVGYSLGNFSDCVEILEFAQADFRELLSQAEALILGGGDKGLLADLSLAEVKNLQFVGIHATGYEHIPEVLIRRAHSREATQLVIVSVPEYATSAVTEYVFAGIFQLLRRPEAASLEYTGSGGFHHFGSPGGELLAGLQIVVFGMGKIGQAVTKAAEAFGATVVPISKSPRKGRVALFQNEDVDRILLESQIVTLNLPDIGQEVLDRARLKSLPEGAIVINSARPSLLDEEALLELVEEGKLRAVLDVLAKPNLLSHWDKCVQSGRAVVTHHVAFNTAPSVTAKAKLFIGNLLAYEESLRVGQRFPCKKMVPFKDCQGCSS